jgi:hypothetical protein
MKTITTGLTLALCFFGAGLSFADDPQMGTWKVNETKSTFAPGATKNHTVVYEAAGDNVKITADGTDKEAYSKVDDRTLKMTVKKDGKVTATGRIVVSADDKSRTVTTSGTDAEGKKIKNMVVYDKQ